MRDTKGFIYILTNPSFPAFVKIGYTDNIEQRLAQLNRTECTPFAFRVYATYAVESRLSDKRVHDIIDKLNPDLRAIDYVGGTERKREFYEMSAQDAFSILEAIAEINAREEHLCLYELTEEEIEEEQEAQEAVERHREKLAPFSFDKCDIQVGEEVVFTCRGNEHSGAVCTVVSNKKVSYEGREWFLSELVCELTGQASASGPQYFKYHDKWLNVIRGEREGWISKQAGVSDMWVIPCDPSYYSIEKAFAELECIEWRQSSHIQEGDIVYIYVSSPQQEIRYKCVAEKTDLYGPAEIDDIRFYNSEPDKDGRRHMRLRLVEEYGEGKFPLSELKQHGLNGNIQGPRHLSTDLEEYLTASKQKD